ncbi:MAG: alpha-2-macroglobulin family protein [Planctomycetota bacterium]
MEEYKRPKFIVDVNKPDAEFRLNELVTLSAVAKAYTGSPIDNAKVSWRVTRQPHYPNWFLARRWWFQPPSTKQEVANGTGMTGADGKFDIEFVAVPDLSIDQNSEPEFHYSIYVDVTDNVGETRSNQAVIKLGYNSVRAKLQCDSWQTSDRPVSLELLTATLDGVPLPRSGELEIFRLKEPDSLQRANLGGGGYSSKFGETDKSKINAWENGESITKRQIETNGEGKQNIKFELVAGAYRAQFVGRDDAGRPVRSELTFIVLNPEKNRFDLKVPHFFLPKSETVEVGDNYEAVWGTGYKEAWALVEIEHRGKVIQSYWNDRNATQIKIVQPVSEELRGGFHVRVTFVRENRAYTESRRINVPWSNKKLSIGWERFVSKLQPGSKETWTAVIKGPDAERVSAEMVATLYDASLDAYAPNRWPEGLGVFYSDYSTTRVNFQNRLSQFNGLFYGKSIPYKSVPSTYRRFNVDMVPSAGRYFGVRNSLGVMSQAAPARASMKTSRGVSNGKSFSRSPAAIVDMPTDGFISATDTETSKGFELGESREQIDLSAVSLRSDLSETAFFFPTLTSNEDGVVRIEFESPETLTQWKFMGFAHDHQLRTALLTDSAVTSKDLMVQPNPPRFLREGDQIEFVAKITNQSATRQTGRVKLELTNAFDETAMDSEFSHEEIEKVFDVPAGESRSVCWKLTVPNFVGVLKYKVVGATTRLSDGEEGLLPVISNRVLVVESFPISIRGGQAKNLDFKRLRELGKNKSVMSQTLTVQMTSNPSWYALMALPYLMDYPHQCSEQIFNRLYANSLGQHIANSNPRIREIFSQWRGTNAVGSPLEKNESIKNVLVAESPWLRRAKNESQSRRRVGNYFDPNRMTDEIRNATRQLQQLQFSDGSWPWFAGGRANDYITLYVTTGFGRLRHLGVPIDVGPAFNALDRMGFWIDQRYQKIKEDGNLERNNLRPDICLYLYGRSFFLKDRPIAAKYKLAVDYFLSQAKEHWSAVGNRQSQGHLAIALKRFGQISTSKSIMASLIERSQTSEEMGMYWREASRSWWWYRAPIETQAVMIEALDEVLGDTAKVEECKIWLLKQKQTQNWPTTKSTADAIYALLLRGGDWLQAKEVVKLELGGETIVPEEIEAGTGYFEKQFVRNEIKPELAEISVAKKDQGIAWGSVHWQYLQDIGEVESYDGTPLKMKKKLFLKKDTKQGPVLEPLEGPVNIGDELVTRIEIQADRDLEFVHLKDYRGSGTEPVNVLSGYKYQDGLGYYESTKDTASHFFIDYLRRGTYVFEYSVRVQLKGVFESGVAELQCMYAPDFNSHSESVEITVLSSDAANR